MISKHAHVFHPMGRTRRTYYNLGPPVVLPKPLYCICGFNTRSGNHLGEWFVCVIFIIKSSCISLKGRFLKDFLKGFTYTQPFNYYPSLSTARHLALCDGGRKSAYPSVMDAMVYRGDHLTGGAVSLANLGLSGLALSGMLSPDLLPQASDEPGTETSLDMTHFMSMSMEVDDE